VTSTPPDNGGDNVVGDVVNSGVANSDGGGTTGGAGDKAPEMSVIAHLEELRWTLIRCICAVIVCAVPCGIYWKRIFELIAVYPLKLSDPRPQIIYTAPAETVMLSLKIALTCGVIVASPFIFQQIWSFVSPALYKKEKRIILPAAIASTLCFISGIAFCYFMLPMLLQFLTAFAGDQIAPLFRIDEYFGFLIKLCLAFGLAFELPVAAFVLSKMGVIDHRFLIKYWRYAVVLIFIIAALLTPPDVLSQILLAMPLLALYGLSVLVAYMASPSARRPQTPSPESTESER
jgi:sec-independent protein translocase protein TatC